MDPTQESALASEPQTWNRYAYTLGSPINLVDPDGQAATLPLAITGGIAGFLVGGGAELGLQLWSGEGTDLRAVFAAGVRGLLVGGTAGLTVGGSLIVSAGGIAVASVAGGAAERALDGRMETDPFDPHEASIDLVSGFVAGGAAHTAFNAVKEEVIRSPAQRVAERLSDSRVRAVSARPASRQIDAIKRAESVRNRPTRIARLISGPVRGATASSVRSIVHHTYPRPDQHIEPPQR